MAIGRAGDYLFRNRRTGGITIVQWPNLALSGFIVASLSVRVFHPTGSALVVLQAIGATALIVWAVDEILRGVNPFRRILGGAVLLTTIAGLIFG